MSSKASKVSKKIVNQRVTTVVQVLTLMEEEAKRKSFLPALSYVVNTSLLRSLTHFSKSVRQGNKYV